MSLEILTGYIFGSIVTGIIIYRGCIPKKIYIEHSKEGMTVQIMDGFGVRKQKYANAYKIKPEEYDGRERTDVLREVK